jgi:DNA-directed RNA polymerase subunit RPC12/RpoP
MESKVKSDIIIPFMPFPTVITCPICGYEVDLWTDEDETRCYICDYKIFQKEKTIH